MKHLAIAAIVLVALGCRGPQVGDATHADVPPPKGPPPAAGNNWPVPPQEAERLLAESPMRLVRIEATEHGVAGAMKGTVAFPNGTQLDVKWKPLPPGNLDGWNNNPRKEIATYAMQRWFLQPRDFVVPTTVVRCVSLDDYRRLQPEAEPTVEDTRCVLGSLSLWLQHVTVPEVLLDPTRFAADRNYAYHLANFNVLAYLVEHRDGRPGNILVADVDTNRRVFAVDNGISFGGLIYNFLTTNWDVIRVPAIRRDTVERLRTIGPKDLAALATLVELRADRKGILRPVRPTAPLDPDQGVRIAAGRVQLGLSREEIDAVARRLAELLAQVDAGTIALF